MSGGSRLSTIGAIVKADFLIRFRRPSTLVIFLLLSASAYLWVPDPATGQALISFNGRRALYNSASIGMATALLASILIGLFGFYVISNAIRRDVESRCGFVLASTTMKSIDYLVGKFAGNVVFLATFIFGFMLTSMTMLLVRGEAPLDLVAFTRQYLLLSPPTIVFVSVVGVTFESIPLLRGRFGDVVYFILFTASFGVVASMMDKQGGGPFFVRCLDYSGMGLVLHQLHSTFGNTNVAIGRMPYDRAKPLFIFEGLRFTRDAAASRLAATLLPIPLLLVARLFFHRFDPVRVKTKAAAGGGRWLGRINRLVKPLSRLVAPLRLPQGSRRTSLVRSAIDDTRLTMMAHPVIILVIAVLALVSMVTPGATLQEGIMPVALAVFAVFIADIPVRERRAGILQLVRSLPFCREHFVVWKLLTTLLVACIFLVVPVFRIALSLPESLLPLLIGLLFTIAASLFLGVVSGNARTFIVGFLTFWYLGENDKHTSDFDFAGLNGVATGTTMTVYAAMAVGLLALTFAAEKIRLRNT